MKLSKLSIEFQYVFSRIVPIMLLRHRVNLSGNEHAKWREYHQLYRPNRNGLGQIIQGMKEKYASLLSLCHQVAANNILFWPHALRCTGIHNTWDVKTRGYY